METKPPLKCPFCKGTSYYISDLGSKLGRYWCQPCSKYVRNCFGDIIEEPFTPSRPKSSNNMTGCVGKKSRIKIIYKGKERPLIDVCKELRFDYALAYGRYKGGYSVEDILSDKPLPRIGRSVKND